MQRGLEEPPGRFCIGRNGGIVHSIGKTVTKRRSISMATKFDAIVVGTGQSGPSMASRLSSEGLKVAVIERQRFGGTCVNTG